jgi:hypothetical protein
MTTCVSTYLQNCNLPRWNTCRFRVSHDEDPENVDVYFSRENNHTPFQE